MVKKWKISSTISHSCTIFFYFPPFHYAVEFFRNSTFYRFSKTQNFTKLLRRKKCPCFFSRGGVEDLNVRGQGQCQGLKKFRGQDQGQIFRGRTLSRPKTKDTIFLQVVVGKFSIIFSAKLFKMLLPEVESSSLGLEDTF